MTTKEELELVLQIMKKHDLPMSPILEYAIKEKMEMNYEPINIKETVSAFEEGSTFDNNEHYPLGDNATIIKVQVFEIPDNADVTIQNKYILQFCYGILSDFSDALSSKEKDICEKLLVENARGRASDKYNLSRERIRQIFVKSVNKISTAYHDSMKKLRELKNENEEIKRRNYLLEQEIKNSKNLENVDSLQKRTSKLCFNARRLLDQPISNLPLSVRTVNSLRYARLGSLKEVVQLDKNELIKIKNFGMKSYVEMKDYLSKFNLEFGLSYNEIITRMSFFTDTDITSENFVERNAEKYPLLPWEKRE